MTIALEEDLDYRGWDLLRALECDPAALGLPVAHVLGGLPDRASAEECPGQLAAAALRDARWGERGRFCCAHIHGHLTLEDVPALRERPLLPGVGVAPAARQLQPRHSQQGPEQLRWSARWAAAVPHGYGFFCDRRCRSASWCSSAIHGAALRPSFQNRSELGRCGLVLESAHWQSAEKA